MSNHPSGDMGTSNGTETALTVLHYLAPVLTAAYFLTAKVVAACYLHQPAKKSGNKFRRYSVIAFQFFVVLTVIAEAISAITCATRDTAWYASQDYIFYLSMQFAVDTSLNLGLIESDAPVWYKYLGTWVISLGFETSIIAIQGVKVPRNPYSKARMAFCVTRVFLLLFLCISTGWFLLSDRTRSVKLDHESDRLLANGANPSTANGHAVKPFASSAEDGLFTSGASATIVEDDDDDAAGFDSDSEEPEKDKELRLQQKQRLQAAGSWLNYIKEFRIFIPLVFPSKNRRIQLYLLIIGLCIASQRVFNILIPTQLGRITTGLASAATTGVLPWKDIGLWMLYSLLNSSAGFPLLKECMEIPVNQYGYKAISTTAFRHIMGLSMSFHTEKNSGELIRSIEQGTNLQDMVHLIFYEVGPMFVDLMIALVYVAMLFDVYMSIILLAVVVIYLWLGTKLTSWSIKQRRDYNTLYREESKVQNEAINNWNTVSHFNRANYESDRYSETVDRYNAAVWRYWLAYNIGSAVQAFVMLVGKLAAAVLAAYRVSQGAAPVGNFVTLVTYWSSIQAPIGMFAWSVRRISQMLTDSERLLQLLTTKPTVVEAQGAPELEINDGEVVFDHVHFAYDPRKTTLKNVDFKVKPGQTVALVGETGGGKSTILKLLYRYYDVTEGTIRIDGQDIRNVTLDSLRDTFGMVPQDPSLFNISIMENIRYARLDATDEEVHEACVAAAIHEKILSFPDGYKAMVGERGVKLSGGELQRVAIARAILRRPKIVMLDEATSMIDAETEATIQAAFKQLTEKRTTFVVAHRLSTIQHADLILVINDGQIVERGTHEELFRLNGKYVALWSKQLSKEVQDIGKILDQNKNQKLVDVSDDTTTPDAGSSDQTA